MFAVKLFDSKHFLLYNKQCLGKEAHYEKGLHRE